MKKLTKLSLVLAFVAAVILVLNVLPTLSLQAKEQVDRFENPDRYDEAITNIEKMRSEIRAKGYSFTVDYNPAMQYSLEQLCNFKPEMKPEDAGRYDEPISSIFAKPPPPTSSYIADYTSVKDQGNCGSCWAFSTAGMFESVLLKHGISTDLSEQWLLSCNNDGWSCNGGWFANSYYLNPGAVLESCFRYKATELACKDTCAYVYIANSSGNASNVSAIKSAIQTYGAVSCAVTSTYYFQAYSGGVFNYDSSAAVNHAVVLVGWDDNLGSAGCWRLKNSWGKGWGEGGLMWIEYGASNVGYGGNYLTY
jgi:C1A family cysteine protease